MYLSQFDTEPAAPYNLSMTRVRHSWATRIIDSIRVLSLCHCVSVMSHYVTRTLANTFRTEPMRPNPSKPARRRRASALSSINDIVPHQRLSSFVGAVNTDSSNHNVTYHCRTTLNYIEPTLTILVAQLLVPNRTNQSELHWTIPRINGRAQNMAVV